MGKMDTFKIDITAEDLGNIIHCMDRWIRRLRDAADDEYADELQKTLDRLELLRPPPPHN